MHKPTLVSGLKPPLSNVPMRPPRPSVPLRAMISYRKNEQFWLKIRKAWEGVAQVHLYFHGPGRADKCGKLRRKGSDQARFVQNESTPPDPPSPFAAERSIGLIQGRKKGEYGRQQPDYNTNVPEAGSCNTVLFDCWQPWIAGDHQRARLLVCNLAETFLRPAQLGLCARVDNALHTHGDCVVSCLAMRN